MDNERNVPLWRSSSELPNRGASSNSFPVETLKKLILDALFFLDDLGPAIGFDRVGGCSEVELLFE